MKTIYCSVSFQSFALHNFAIASICSTKKQSCFTGSKFVPHNTPIAHRSQTCNRVSRKSEVVKINCISETIYGLSTLGPREPVTGYRHKMMLCSHLEYQICNCVHSYPISPCGTPIFKFELSEQVCAPHNTNCKISRL